MNKQIVGRVQHKHDIEANWLKAENFIPLDGELIIYDVDEEHSSPRFKVGDGETLVSFLPFTDSSIEAGEFAYFEEEDGTIDEGVASTLDADSLGGIPASQYLTSDVIETNYVKAVVGTVDLGETPLIEADYAKEADNSASLENKTVNELFATLFEVEHPVGSLYLSMSATDNPNTKWSVFGINCTWELVPDVFLLGSGGTYELGATGGEAEHAITVDEMPEHNHSITSYYDDANYNHGTIPANDQISMPYDSGTLTRTQHTDSIGGGQPHNNMPPYIAANIWKRIS